jgi:hypothetical protein
VNGDVTSEKVGNPNTPNGKKEKIVSKTLDQRIELFNKQYNDIIALYNNNKQTFLFALKTELYHSFFWRKIMVRITIKYRAKISIHAKVN